MDGLLRLSPTLFARALGYVEVDVAESHTAAELSHVPDMDVVVPDEAIVGDEVCVESHT